MRLQAAQSSGGASRWAGIAGVLASIVAALCCIGVPAVVGVLASIGLSFIRHDAILFPLIALSLALALWGFWAGSRAHGSMGPLIVGAVGGVALVAGVLSARWPLVVGAILLLAATIWNIVAYRRPRMYA